MVSNRNLALLLVITIVISLGGTIISLNKLNQFGVTGMATGYVNLTLGNSTACNVDTNVTFGSGNPIATLTLSTTGDSGAAARGFTNCSTSGSGCNRGIQINNTGNTILWVNFSSNKNASLLLGDMSANESFVYGIRNGTYNASSNVGCTAGLGTSGNINYNANVTVCQNLGYTNTLDIVSIGFNITINESTPKDSKQADIVVSCSQA
jgi:hypothetical protein